MKVVDVFEQYFRADLVFCGVPRRAAAVKLTATSEEGRIRYEVGVTFFPHESDDDFGISYDAYSSQVLSDEKGRRSRKKDEKALALLRSTADSLAAAKGGTIFWNEPLIEERRG